jgi:CheY-like chemotaxis protein
MPVLVVDDNATNRRILDEMLRQWGMRPTVVDNGNAALAALEQAIRTGEPFALALLDVQMPDMDGFELAQRIQQQPDFAGATIMMLTSGGRPGDAVRCRELGIAAFLTKPLRQSELRKAIQGVLGASTLRASGQAADVKPGAKCRPLRILLAEDNPINQKLAVRLLEKQGHATAVAGDGREAIAAWETGSFDLILMDVQMPEVDGFMATAAIREREMSTGRRRIPILAMTAYAMKGDRERCLDCGMDGYVSKPIRSDELYAAIQALVEPNGEREPAVPTSPPLLELVDWQSALNYVGGDEELLRELTQTFVSECPRWLKALDAALSRNDAAGVSAAAHPFKNSLSVLGAKSAADFAFRLEKMGRGNDLTGSAEVRKTLQAELDELLPALSHFAERAAAVG